MKKGRTIMVTRANYWVAVAALLGTATAAQAHRVPCHPYAITMVCSDDMMDCKSHLSYAPGQSLASNPAYSYWYAFPAPPGGRHKHHHHFKDFNIWYPVWAWHADGDGPDSICDHGHFVKSAQ
jgi:hypothetical protein